MWWGGEIMRAKPCTVNSLFPFLSLFHMQEVGRRMGLETNKLSSLWKDRAVVEINVAVLYSFQVSQRVRYLERRWILSATFSFRLQRLCRNIVQGTSAQWRLPKWFRLRYSWFIPGQVEESPFPVIVRKKSQVKTEGRGREKEVKGKIVHPFNTYI